MGLRPPQAPSGFDDLISMACPKCGASMRPVASTGPGGITMGCSHCGGTEELSSEAYRRVRLLREQRLAAERAERMLSDKEALFCAQLEGQWVSGTLKGTIAPLAVFSAFAIGGAVTTEDWRGALFGGAWTAALLLIVGGMLGGFLVAKRRYRATVRPLILARPPAAPDARARCCGCGGQLPESPFAFRNCEYCGATNLVTPELAEYRASALGKEAAFYQARADAAKTHLHEHVAYVHRAITVGYGAALGLIALLALAVMAVLIWTSH
ncbi:MAG: hypothetical protein AAF721_05925 [Myxococcota bacterium]